MMHLFKKLTTIFTVFCFSFLCVEVANASTSTIQKDYKISDSKDSAGFTKQEFENAFEDIFTKALHYDPQTKMWSVNYAQAEILFPGQIDELVAITYAFNSKTTGYQDRSASSYAKCVVLGSLGLDSLVDVNWRQVGDWLYYGAWKKVANYLWPKVAKHAGKVALKGAFKFTPAGLALSLASSAVTCAIWG